MSTDPPHDEHVRAADAGPLVVDGVTVGPPVTEGQARGLASAGWLADDPDGLGRVWRRIEETWRATVGSARADHADLLGVRCDGEWSFMETLRHLVFVIDTWIGVGVLGRQERHPLGVPPHFVPDPGALGLDLDAEPDLDEVLAVRADKQALVRDTLATMTVTGLSAPCHANLSSFPALGAFQVLMSEEAAHHRFATRDLARLTR